MFPSLASETCATLGIPEAGPPLEDDPVLQLSSRLESYVQSESCIPMEEAQIRVRHILDGLGLEDWAVTLQPQVPGRPCASLGIDPQNPQVLVIPVPDPTDR